jgi:hypothetical protein
VNVKRWTSGFVAMSATVALATAAPAAPNPKMAVAPAYDDGLLIVGDGAMILLPNHSPRGDNSDLLRFRTDVCGVLQSVENRGSMVRQSSFDDDMDLDEDDNPSGAAADVIGHWLSAHAEIAVITDGVEKSCDDSLFDEDQPTSTIASWTPRSRHTASRGASPPQRLAAAYIA